MKAFIKKVYKIIYDFTNRLNEDHVYAYATQSAFFIVISAFPLALLVFSLIRFTPVTEDFLLSASSNVMPETLKPLAESLIREIYEKTSGTVISITALFTVWSASKGVLSIIRGLNNVFGIKEKRNYFVLRLISSLYTVLFVVGIVLSLVMIVFGNTLLGTIQKHIPILYDVVEWIIGMRILYVPIILTLLFVGLYKLVDDKKYTFINHLPGALFSALGWVGFSFFYSIYIDNFAGKSYAYGSLTTIVLLMLWIYICTYILFIGAEINVYFGKSVRYYKRKIQDKIKKDLQKK
jgi:membrane protein